MTSAPRTLYDKLWDAHVVVPESDSAPAVLYIDLHLIHEVTSPQAFTELRERGLSPRRPDRTKATMDHSTPTLPAAADGTLRRSDRVRRAACATVSTLIPRGARARCDARRQPRLAAGVSRIERAGRLRRPAALSAP